jgi:hypothetical protein
MKKLLVGALIVLALLACANAGTIIIGTANSNNCIPWSCPSITGGSPYEQIYNSSAFSGSIDIGSIDFYNTFTDNGSQQSIATLDYSIYLAVTSQSVPDGSTPPGAVLFASGHLSDGLWPFGNTLTFTGTPFLYDPTMGNLELVVDISNASDPSNGVYTYFDAESGGPFSRWCPNCGNGEGYGLVTGFGTGGGTTPEPSSLLLTTSGLLAVAGVIRRKLAK